MYIKVIKTDNEFDIVKDEWISFEKKVNNQNITSSYIWQRTWWKNFKEYEKRAFGYNKRLCILFLYSTKDELRAIAPFCVVMRKGMGLIPYKTIEFIAQQWGAIYLDIISNTLNNDEYEFIFDWLKNNMKYDVIELKYIPEFTRNFDLSKSNVTILSACPEIRIKNYRDVTHYRQREYSKNLKQNLRTAKNRIKRKKVNCREEIFESINITDLEKVEAVSRSKLIDNKHCIYNDVNKKIFLQEIYINYELSTNIVAIMLDNKLACYRINFLYNQNKYCFDAAYDRTYRYFMVGRLSVDLNILDSFKKGIYIHCMGPGIEPYKMDYSKQISRIYTFLKKGNTLKGILLYILIKRHNRRIENTFLKGLEANLYKGKK